MRPEYPANRHAFILWLQPEVTKFVAGEPVTVRAAVAYGWLPRSERQTVRSALRWGGLSIGGASAGEVAGAVRQLEVRRDGRLLLPRKAWPRSRRWVRRLREASRTVSESAWRKSALEFRLDERFDLAEPGRYTVRLVVPPEETGERRYLASNLIEFDVIGSKE